MNAKEIIVDEKCFFNKYHPILQQCQKSAKWKGKGTNNPTDNWKWCDDHAPKTEQFREKI